MYCGMAGSSMKNGMVEFPDGTRKWYCHDRLHREDGPAVEYPDGTLRWYWHDRRHRDDGPAVVYGMEHPRRKLGVTHQWYYDGAWCDLATWFQLNKQLTQKQKIKILLVYGK